MNISAEEQKRHEFRQILLDLASNVAMFKDKAARAAMYKRLESLYYSDNEESAFRHYYSDIFAVLTEIQNDTSLGSIDVLGQNLAFIRNGYNPQNVDDAGNQIDISNSIRKLYDHVNLDIARILYSDAGDRQSKSESALADVKAQVNQLEAEIGTAKEEQKALKDDLSSQQKEYITILGIFAAIVITFTAGIAFSTSVLENISNISIYRLLIIALVIGFVLINVLYALFHCICRLVTNRERAMLWPLIISNAVALILIATVILAWRTGFVENRDSEFAHDAVYSTGFGDVVFDSSTSAEIAP